MNILLVLCAVLGAFLTWLVVTDKIKLPIMVDFGVAAIVMGMVVWADTYSVYGDLISFWGLAMIAVGGLLLIASQLRQKTLRKKAHRKDDPKEIDGRHFQRIHGGKRP